MRKRSTLALLLILLLAGCGGASSGGQAGASLETMEPVSLVFNEASPAGSGLADVADAYMDEIERRTDGKVTFERYYGGTLANATETLTAVSSGLADIGLLVGSNFPGELPLLNSLRGVGSITAPYPTAYLETQSATLDLFWRNGALQDEFAAKNTRPIFLQTPPPADMVCTSEVSTPADAEGRIARMGGDLWAAEAESLGFTSTYIQLGELYEALQRGTVDCVAISSGAVVYGQLGLYETAKYFLPVTFSSQFGNGYIMNLDAWNALPADVQQIFDEVAVQFAADSTEGMVRLMADAVELMDESGVTFMDVEALDEVLREQQEATVDEMRAAVSGTESEAILDEYEGYLARWAEYFANTELPATGDRSPEAVRTAMLEAPDAVDWDAYRQELAQSAATE